MLSLLPIIESHFTDRAVNFFVLPLLNETVSKCEIFSSMYHLLLLVVLHIASSKRGDLKMNLVEVKIA